MVHSLSVAANRDYSVTPPSVDQRSREVPAVSTRREVLKICRPNLTKATSSGSQISSNGALWLTTPFYVSWRALREQQSWDPERQTLVAECRLPSCKRLPINGHPGLIMTARGEMAEMSSPRNSATV